MTRAEAVIALRRAERHLRTRDTRLAGVMKRVGPCTIEPHRQYFRALVRSIVGQQLSGKAAATIYGRFVALYPADAQRGGTGRTGVRPLRESVQATAPADIAATPRRSGQFPAPADILATPDTQLRAIGLSRGKTAYIKDLCARVEDGRLPLDRVSRLGDEELMAALVAVKGVGAWTAHMFMIFSLCRLDVLPTGDLGVRKGMQRLYKLPTLPTPDEMRALADRQRWAPYRSVASWYMWAVIDQL